MASSPAHPRRPSSISISSQPPSTHSRRSSNLSHTSCRSSRVLNGSDDSSALNTPSSGRGFGLPASGMHDNLADELAGAFDDDEDGYSGSEAADTSQLDGSIIPQASPPMSPLVKCDPTRVRDSGIDVYSPSTTPASTPTHHRQPSKSERTRNHSRKASQHDTLSNTIKSLQGQVDLPRSLLQTMKELENLTLQTTATPTTILEEPTQTPENLRLSSPVSNLATTLQSLGSQQNSLESYATRLITAHTSLTAHLAHQTRSLSSTTYFFLSPLPSQPLFEEEQIDTLLPAINHAISSLPQPTIEALASMDRLVSSSKDAISSLATLSDTIHMMRQTSSTAARRMRVTKDMVSELRRELQQAEDAKLWVERGDWETKLRERNCKTECGDIVGGFESVCESWREKLFGHGQLGVV